MQNGRIESDRPQDRPSMDGLEAALMLKREAYAQAHKVESAISILQAYEKQGRPIPLSLQETYQTELAIIKSRTTKHDNPETLEHVLLTTKVNVLGARIGVLHAETAIDESVIDFYRQSGIAISDEALQAAIKDPKTANTTVRAYIHMLHRKGVDVRELFIIPANLREAENIQNSEERHAKPLFDHYRNQAIRDYMAMEGMTIEQYIEIVKRRMKEINFADGDRQLYLLKLSDITKRTKIKNALITEKDSLQIKLKAYDDEQAR